ncbi:MAG: hypothetical protein WA584_19940 [Pyrinomonadaceae bacterium]
MDNQKFNLVLDKILERTNQGRLEWETTANRNTFLAVLQDSAISIAQNFDDYDGDLPECEIYTFDFRNENGEIVESIDVYDADEELNSFEKAKKIFELAKQQQSSKTDKTLDHILEQLAA